LLALNAHTFTVLTFGFQRNFLKIKKKKNGQKSSHPKAARPDFVPGGKPLKKKRTAFARD